MVRRELSDNFCYYQPNYDSLAGAWDWARTTLEDHRNDKREHVYTREQLELAKTHDDVRTVPTVHCTLCTALLGTP